MTTSSPLPDGPGFHGDASRDSALQISNALAALLTTVGLSLSLGVAIGSLSFDLIRAASSWIV